MRKQWWMTWPNINRTAQLKELPPISTAVKRKFTHNSCSWEISLEAGKQSHWTAQSLNNVSTKQGQEQNKLSPVDKSYVLWNGSILCKAKKSWPNQPLASGSQTEGAARQENRLPNVSPYGTPLSSTLPKEEMYGTPPYLTKHYYSLGWCIWDTTIYYAVCTLGWSKVLSDNKHWTPFPSIARGDILDTGTYSSTLWN